MTPATSPEVTGRSCTVSATATASATRPCARFVGPRSTGGLGDVAAFAGQHEGGQEIPRELLKQAIHSLIKTGDLEKVPFRGGGSRGRHFLALPGQDVAVPADAEETWLQHVARVFDDLWRERIHQATDAERRPIPITTGEVRERVRREGAFSDQLENPQLLVNALAQLAKTQNPVLYKLKKPGKRANYYVPFGFTQDDVDLGDAYESDTGRIREAVRRAEFELGRPANVYDVEEVIERDVALRPGGRLSTYQVLSDAARSRINGQPRVNQILHKVGAVEGRTYFTTGDISVARAYVKLQSLSSTWTVLLDEDPLDSIEACAYPQIRYGRALRFAERAREIAEELEAVCAVAQTARFSREIADLSADVDDRVARAGRILSLCLDESLPTDVREGTGLTAEELKDLLAPIYPMAKSAEPVVVNRGMNRAIRRIPNPDHTFLFDDNPLLAAEALFDLPHTLIVMCLRWGGIEAQLHANVANHVLGPLRDPRFVLPLTLSEDPDTRSSAASCLAFLQEQTSARNALKSLEGDPDPLVRESVRWALGFAGDPSVSREPFAEGEPIQIPKLHGDGMVRREALYSSAA